MTHITPEKTIRKKVRGKMDGFNVTGFGLDEEKIKYLNSGKTYIKHIPVEDIKAFKGD